MKLIVSLILFSLGAGASTPINGVPINGRNQGGPDISSELELESKFNQLIDELFEMTQTYASASEGLDSDIRERLASFVNRCDEAIRFKAQQMVDELYDEILERLESVLPLSIFAKKLLDEAESLIETYGKMSGTSPENSFNKDFEHVVETAQIMLEEWKCEDPKFSSDFHEALAKFRENHAQFTQTAKLSFDTIRGVMEFISDDCEKSSSSLFEGTLLDAVLPAIDSLELMAHNEKLTEEVRADADAGKNLLYQEFFNALNRRERPPGKIRKHQAETKTSKIVGMGEFALRRAVEKMPVHQRV